MANKQQIVESIAALASRLDRAPTLSEFTTQEKVSKHEIFRHYARWNDAVRDAGLQPRQRSVTAGCPEATPMRQQIIYGNPVNFRCLRHEPVNEQGVVLLFGMVAAELGYTIEAVQRGFPDCEAKRQIGPHRWERVRIEFEFESKNFLTHGHPLTGCDVIVCWRHNWPDCPSHLEIVELSSFVRARADSCKI
jgi:Homing endonuclease associated repeat